MVVVKDDSLNRSLARQRRNKKRSSILEDESEFITLLTGTLKPPTIIAEQSDTISPVLEKPGILAGDQTMSRYIIGIKSEINSYI